MLANYIFVYVRQFRSQIRFITTFKITHVYNTQKMPAYTQLLH